MTRSVVQQLVQRATSDAAFRRQLREDPQTALRGFDLTADERSAITSADSGRLSGMGVDVRMSKVFAAGALEASRSSISDLTPGAASAAAIPPTHLQMVENDINALSTASAEGDALIGGGPSHLQMVEGALDAGTAAVQGGGVPSHLQMVEGALDTSGSTDVADSSSHLQRLERDLDLGSGASRTAFEDHSGFTPVLEGGTVAPATSIDGQAFDPGITDGGDVHTP
jgi:hypothetical protein